MRISAIHPQPPRFGQFAEAARPEFERLGAVTGQGKAKAMAGFLDQIIAQGNGVPTNSLLNMLKGEDISTLKRSAPVKAVEELLGAHVDRLTTRFMVGGTQQMAPLQEALQQLNDSPFVFEPQSQVAMAASRAKAVLAISKTKTDQPPTESVSGS